MTGVPLNINIQQIMLHLFNFTILFGMLYILLYKPVKDFMDKREKFYAEMDSNAKKELAEAENLKADIEDRWKNFEEEAKSEKIKLRKEIEEARVEQLNEAKANAEKIIENARIEAEREKQEILDAAKHDITALVTEAMEKLAVEQTQSEAFDQFLDAAEIGDK